MSIAPYQNTQTRLAAVLDYRKTRLTILKAKLSLFHPTPSHEEVQGSGSLAPRIFNLGVTSE